MRGQNAGKTAVPLPLAARLPVPITNNLVKPLHTGYLTDQRSFSPSPNASVRMQSFITIDFPDGRVSGLHQTSGTTEVNMETGETRDNADADMSDCTHSPAYTLSWSLAEDIYNRRYALTERQLKSYALEAIRRSSKYYYWDKSQSKLEIMVNVKGAASDPSVRHAADIDYDVSFNVCVDLNNGMVIVSCLGLIDDFPAFEAYAKYQGRTQTLFIVPPPYGNTVVNLLGSANRYVGGVTMFGPATLIPATPVFYSPP